jgi:hypothetical protein
MGVKISELNETNELKNGCCFPIVQDGVTKKVRFETLKNLIKQNSVNGQDGKDGASAYELACKYGYVGTEEQWIQSLSSGGDSGNVDLTDLENKINKLDGESVGLVTNSQFFTIKIKKNHPYWFGFFKFEYLHGTHLCEIAVGIQNNCSYIVTKGSDDIENFTYDIIDNVYIFGIKMNGVKYGTECVHITSDFGEVVEFTDNEYTGNTIVNRIYSSLETDLQSLQTDFTDLQTDVNTLETNVNNLQTNGNTVNSQIESLVQRDLDLKMQIRVLLDTLITKNVLLANEVPWILGN